MILYKPIEDSINEVIDFINQNLDEDLSVQALSARFKFSETTFRRYFKSHSRLPLHQYVMIKRMERAIELLKSDRLPIKTVALMVGYMDVSSFSHAFIKHHSITPILVLKTALQL